MDYSKLRAEIVSIGTNSNIHLDDCYLSINLEMSAHSCTALLKLEIDLYTKGKNPPPSGAGASKDGKADIGQKVEDSNFRVFFYIRPEDIGTITCLESEPKSVNNTTQTVLRFSMLKAAMVIHPPNIDFTLLRRKSSKRWEQFQTLQSATEFSVSFDRGDKVRKDDVDYLLNIFSPTYKGARPHADERRGDTATLYRGAGGMILRTENDKSIAIDSPSFVKKTYKRPQADSGESENDMRPSKRLNARIKQIEDRLKDIVDKVDQLSTVLDDHSCRLGSEDRKGILEEVYAEWSDMDAELLGIKADMHTELDLGINDGIREMKDDFERVREEFETNTSEFVSDIAHDTAKDVVRGVRDVLRNDVAEVVSKVVKDDLKITLGKVVEDVVKGMKEEIVRDVKKALMRGMALSLDVET
ncbi:hypothetical protein HDV63DRAFT_382476 [Trichoderma sp. SZMC 28014]